MMGVKSGRAYVVDNGFTFGFGLAVKARMLSIKYENNSFLLCGSSNKIIY